mmetsp:Transcript_27041/g.44119  ORF Transcript_27041/g.44119 Transcript_27041/m.44119 type:complete len:500 (-) Transcript_27041:212-1711(-)|eukprot:CAMPEP_0184654530 /NCGR_PEP_ID=MMETSP0308-20130426/12208_1 /TAXON_ID=38269 /ORGANISM="Gloeochaete witrockiana, Strain SAG 46.84" /LENGTH=499 /DNA_ID=CAMNT_0027090559 /DNA_START=315 /DNA_END=1814 /DNA_ORIENTATION=+
MSSNVRKIHVGEKDLKAAVQKGVQSKTCIGIRARIYRTFEDPSSSIAAQAIATFLIGMILLTSTASIVQTLPEYRGRDVQAWGKWDTIDAIAVATFTVEFLARICCCPSLLAFAKEPMNYIDLATFLPFYVILGLQSEVTMSTTLIRLFRLTRFARLIKVARYHQGLQVFTDTLIVSLEPLGLLLIFLSLAVVLYGSAIYVFEERAEANESSPFNSIPQSMWWAIVTLTTVGYGDMFPTTAGGKVVGACCMITGILTLALPIGVIGNNFTQAFQKMVNDKEKAARERRIRTALKQKILGAQLLNRTVDVVRNSTPSQGTSKDNLSAPPADQNVEVSLPSPSSPSKSPSASKGELGVDSLEGANLLSHLPSLRQSITQVYAKQNELIDALERELHKALTENEVLKQELNERARDAAPSSMSQRNNNSEASSALWGLKFVVQQTSLGRFLSDRGSEWNQSSRRVSPVEDADVHMEDMECAELESTHQTTVDTTAKTTYKLI